LHPTLELIERENWSEHPGETAQETAEERQTELGVEQHQVKGKES